MKAPDKIYIHIGPHLGLMQANKIPVGAPDEKEFISKDALLEWANLEIKKLDDFLKRKYSSMELGQRVILVRLIDKLNSL